MSVSLAAFLCCFSFGATVSLAQDQSTQSVADAARQERARKHDEQKPSAHVYTNEDLSRAHILTPSDRVVAEAKRNDCAEKKNCKPAAPQNSPASLDANSGTNGTSLGEVARQYRKQKELQALKPKQSAPFHLPFSAPALASPVLPERPALRSPVQPVFHPKSSSQVFRRDPFSSVPVRPHVPARARIDSAAAPPKNIQPTFRPDVRENVRPSSHPNAQPATPKKVMPLVQPSTVQPTVVQPRVVQSFAVQQPVQSNVRPVLRPDFHKIVRPNISRHPRLIAPAQPKIFSRLAAPAISIRSEQPVAPVFSVKPEGVRAPQPNLVRPSQTFSAARTVNVQPGDSLWKLSQKNLGHGSRWHELAAANPWIANPNRIRPGVSLALPSSVAAPTSFAAAVSPIGARTGSSIQVHRGDTLWTLARANLGRSAAWPCLAAANPGIANPNRIFPGQLLILPAGCGSPVSSSALSKVQ